MRFWRKQVLLTLATFLLFTTVLSFGNHSAPGTTLGSTATKTNSAPGNTT